MEISFVGSALSILGITENDNFIVYGVVNVVIADTATAMGYKKSLVIFKLIPSVAIINENSPIRAKLKPVWIEVFSFCPEIIDPTVTENIFPKITSKVIKIISL